MFGEDKDRFKCKHFRAITRIAPTKFFFLAPPKPKIIFHKSNAHPFDLWNSVRFSDLSFLEIYLRHPSSILASASNKLNHAILETTLPLLNPSPQIRGEATGSLKFEIASWFVGMGEVKSASKAALVVEKGILTESKGIAEAGLKIFTQTQRKILPATEELIEKGISGFAKGSLLEKIIPKNIPFLSLPRFIVHEGKQGKHILGHNNYRYPNSILTHPDPQALVSKFAGTGTGMGPGKLFPEAGYKERIDFGEVIGKYVEVKTGKSYPTRVGSIEYSRKNVHIVPRKP